MGVPDSLIPNQPGNFSWVESDSDQSRHSKGGTVNIGLFDANKLPTQCANLQTLPLLVSLVEESHVLSASTGETTFTANRTGVFVICAYTVNNQGVSTGAFFQSNRIPSLFVASSVIPVTATPASATPAQTSAAEIRSTQRSINSGVIGGIVAGVLALLIAIAVTVFVLLRRRRRFGNLDSSTLVVNPFEQNSDGKRAEAGSLPVPPRVIVHADSGWRPEADSQSVDMMGTPPEYTDADAESSGKAKS
ncbi:hypothetical protein Moror_1184 [Moniliophthora roreri MCA 2997]|uniref:Uncharacterized protein n=2 Tax=Moniliophthora roreri TaxID=221103 RepID=V2XAZ3_MONRO|nr:hypothetical protein Moror_1184 [Moniliophthora roreri MCA 2997]